MRRSPIQHTLLLLVGLLSLLVLTGCKQDLRDLVNEDRWWAGRSLLGGGGDQTDLGIAAQLLADYSAGRLDGPPNDDAVMNKYECVRVMVILGATRGVKSSHDLLMSLRYDTFMLHRWRWVGTGYSTDANGYYHLVYYLAAPTNNDHICHNNRLVGVTKADSELMVRQDSTTLVGSDTKEGASEQFLSYETMEAYVPQLDGTLLRSALLVPSLRSQGFYVLLTGNLPNTDTQPTSLQVTQAQLDEANQLIEKVAQTYPEFQDELLKAWEEYQASLQVVTR